ncbi:CMRF35-like molecule 9 isoform X5 [Tupaia chinensis]|uniref:CMRF35-like molecule 9 isoform X5 n=1 Tax=Tupaia chinensis TaxID=246437 RepID=UPI0003C900C1|nr:CMRF35-like molecule 9 isoform X5 [Tupaia chinensis]
MWPLVVLWGCLVLPGYEALEGPKEVSGFEGDTVSLRCTYSEELREHRKYWCKKGGLLISRCSTTVYAGADGQRTTRGRVSILDSRSELAFTVTLRNLTLQDAGDYWCGVNRLGRDESFLVSLFVFPGSSRPAMQLDSSSTRDISSAPSSSSSKPSSRASIQMVRKVAPVLVLLILLLATVLITCGSHMVRRRREAQLATEGQRDGKVYLSALLLGNSWVPQDTPIHLAGPPGPHASTESPASLYMEIQCLGQTTGEEDAPSQDPNGDAGPVPPIYMSEEDLDFSKFVSV